MHDPLLRRIGESWCHQRAAHGDGGGVTGGNGRVAGCFGIVREGVGMGVRAKQCGTRVCVERAQRLASFLEICGEIKSVPIRGFMLVRTITATAKQLDIH